MAALFVWPYFEMNNKFVDVYSAFSLNVNVVIFFLNTNEQLFSNNMNVVIFSAQHTLHE